MAYESNQKTFPANEVEALAYAYLQSKNIKNKRPEELAQIYQEAYNQILLAFEKKATTGNEGLTHIELNQWSS